MSNGLDLLRIVMGTQFNQADFIPFAIMRVIELLWQNSSNKI